MIKPVDDRVNVCYHRIDFTFGFYSPAGITHNYPFRIPLKTPGTDLLKHRYRYYWLVPWKSCKDEFEIENGMEYDLIPITQTQNIFMFKQIGFCPNLFGPKG